MQRHGVEPVRHGPPRRHGDGTIENRDLPLLTASFEDMSSSHDGDAFRFRFRFSDEPKVSFRTLREHAVDIEHGTVTRARRVDGRGDLREVHVESDGNDDISIRRNASRDRDDEHAVCTDDGRPRSNSLAATVRGPVGISVDGAQADEGAGAAVGFTVALSRTASSAMSTRRRGARRQRHVRGDYTATFGTLIIGANSSSGTTSVPILGDSHNEGGNETFTLTLSCPSSGTLTGATATDTIKNHDAMAGRAGRRLRADRSRARRRTGRRTHRGASRPWDRGAGRRRGRGAQQRPRRVRGPTRGGVDSAMTRLYP